MVQTSNACCEKQEVGELEAFKYCEQDFCLGREFSVFAMQLYFLKNGTALVSSDIERFRLLKWVVVFTYVDISLSSSVELMGFDPALNAF